MKNEHENKLSLAWLGGVVDGEGNVALYPKKGGVDARIAITSVNKRMIDNVEQILTRNNIEFGRTSYEKKNKTHRRAYYIHVCSHSDLEKLTSLILPYLVIKKEVAELLRLWSRQRQKNKKMGEEEKNLLKDYQYIKEYTALI